MIGQKEWIKKNYTDKGIIPWECSCGNGATLHDCSDGQHKFYCNECIKKMEDYMKSKEINF